MITSEPSVVPFQPSACDADPRFPQLAGRATKGNQIRTALIRLLLAVVLSPVFIRFPDLELLLLRLLEPTVPPRTFDHAISLLSLFIAACGIPLIPAFLRGILEKKALFLTTLALTAYLFLLGAVAWLRSGDTYPLLGATQYAFPIVAITIGYLFQRKWKIDWAKIFTLFLVLNVLLPSLVFFYFYFSRDEYNALSALHVTNRYFYALFSHIPAMILIASILLLGWVEKRNYFFIIPVSVTSALWIFYTTWSRAAILTAIMALLTCILLLSKLVFSYKALSLKAHLLSCVLLIAASVFVPSMGMIGYREAVVVDPPAVREKSATPIPQPLPSLPSGNTSPSLKAEAAAPSARPSAEESQPAVNTLRISIASRLYYMREGLRRWSKSPVLGIMFTPDTHSLIYGNIVHKKQIFQSHNQYLDILLKTGVVGLVFFVFFYTWFVLRPLLQACLGSVSIGRKRKYIVTVAVIVGIAAAANFQLYLTVWTTGVPLAFVMGYMLSTADQERQGHFMSAKSRSSVAPS